MEQEDVCPPPPSFSGAHLPDPTDSSGKQDAGSSCLHLVPCGRGAWRAQAQAASHEDTCFRQPPLQIACGGRIGVSVQARVCVCVGWIGLVACTRPRSQYVDCDGVALGRARRAWQSLEDS